MTTRLGIIGLGIISGQYFDHLLGRRDIQVTRVADAFPERTAQVAAERDIPGLTPEALLASEEVDFVICLTTPDSHAAVCRAALEHGKGAWTEKPLAIDLADGEQLVALAAEKGLLLGAAPDTVLGTGVQTARAVIDQGMIGAPYAANVVWGNPGPDLWHPNPDFLFQPGAGPLFDNGPYVVASAVNLLGPVVQVVGMANTSDRERVVVAGPRAGEKVDVQVDTHVVSMLRHESGAITTMTMSFELWGTRQPVMEVHGSKGSLNVPDPNWHSGEVEVHDAATKTWRAVPPMAGYRNAGRGIGVIDLLNAEREGRSARASGELGVHVLEVMQRVLDSAGSNQVLDITTRPERPSMVPLT